MQKLLSDQCAQNVVTLAKKYVYMPQIWDFHKMTGDKIHII